MYAFKSISVKVSPADHERLQAIAAKEGRRLNDLCQILFSHGLSSFFCESQIHIKRRPEDYTEKELQQIEKNKELEATEGWSDLGFQEREERGYLFIYDHIGNHCRNDNGDYVDRLIEPLAERIKSFALD